MVLSLCLHTAKHNIDLFIPILEDADQLAAENTDDSNHDEKGGAPLREQDRFLPIANVAKIMKKAIPETGKVNNKVHTSNCVIYM